MASSDYTGQTLDDRYHVDKLVGQGGMGRVYAGRHARLGRKVAIKVLAAELAGNDEMVARFFREARAAAAIGHRNIIDVIDVGVTSKSDPYLVMEYLEGESLAALISRRGAVDLTTACGIVEPVLQALAAAHKAGIVHRDLKPENVFLSYPEDGDPVVKLIDFGISKVTLEAQNTRLTDTGQLLGTPAYMAPEQAEDAAEADQRTDIYAVGVLLYELLSGVLPFDASSNFKLLAQVLKGEPTPPKRANPSFPDIAIPLVLRAMARNPADRFQSAVELLEEVRALAAAPERQECMRRLATGVFKTTLPQGALGSVVSNGGGDPDATAMLAEIVQRSTPSKRGGSADTKPPRRRAAVVSLGIVVALGIGYVAVGRGGTGAAKPEPVAATSTAQGAAAEEATVELDLRGVPANAKVFYDHAEVDKVPFRVRAGRALVPLRIVAPGYQDFGVSITPDRSQTVDVALTPSVATAAASASDLAPVASGKPQSDKAKLPSTKPAPKTATQGSTTPEGFKPKFE